MKGHENTSADRNPPVLWLLCCQLNCWGRYKRQQRIVSVDLSENEKELLVQLVAQDGQVSDEILLGATEIDPKEYDPAALGLIKKKYAETQAQISDPSSLKATSKGIRRARKL
jgi:hypothetical protein